MTKRRLGIVIPVGPDEDIDRWTRSVHSVLLQSRTDFDLNIVQVVRKDRIGDVVKVRGCSGHTIIFEPKSKFLATAHEQVQRGFEYLSAGLGDHDLVMAWSANDMMAPGYLRFLWNAQDNNSEASVFYGDALLTGPIFRELVSWEYGNPEDWQYEYVLQQSIIPDMAAVRNHVLRIVPFDGTLLGGAFRIWWLKILVTQGLNRFVHIPERAFIFVREATQLSQNEKWIKAGAKKWHGWLDSWDGKDRLREILDGEANAKFSA